MFSANGELFSLASAGGDFTPKKLINPEWDNAKQKKLSVTKESEVCSSPAFGLYLFHISNFQLEDEFSKEAHIKELEVNYFLPKIRIT